MTIELHLTIEELRALRIACSWAESQGIATDITDEKVGHDRALLELKAKVRKLPATTDLALRDEDLALEPLRRATWQGRA